MLTSVHRAWDRISNSLKLAIMVAMAVMLIVFRHPFAWPLLAAILSAGIDVAYPRVKRRFGLPDWEPNEAYITKLRRRHRAGKEANDPVA
jgi:hypothetical protein